MGPREGVTELSLRGGGAPLPGRGGPQQCTKKKKGAGRRCPRKWKRKGVPFLYTQKNAIQKGSEGGVGRVLSSSPISREDKGKNHTLNIGGRVGGIRPGEQGSRSYRIRRKAFYLFSKEGWIVVGRETTPATSVGRRGGGVMFPI